MPHRTSLHSKQSPLLRLPPEIRNIIYRYAIGGYLIQVSSGYRPSNRQLEEHLERLQNPRQPEGDGELIRHRVFPGLDPSYGSAHLAVERPMSIAQVFNISLVCRQLASETALLQYKHNLFELDVNILHRYYGQPYEEWVLDLGVTGFSLEQRTAIQEISICGVPEMDFIADRIRHTPARSIRFTFPSLQRVYINVIWMDDLSYFEMAAREWVHELLPRDEGRDRGLELILLRNDGPTPQEIIRISV